MKKLLANLGGKVAAFAEEVASYNDPARYTSHNKAQDPRNPAAPAHSGFLEGDNLHPVVEHLIRNVRSKHVRQHFSRTPAAQYTQHRKVTIQAATFNVGGKKPPPGFKLDDWLGAGPAAGGMKGRWPQTPTSPGTGGAVAATASAPAPAPGAAAALVDGPDVVAIGFEELVPLNAGHVMGVLASGHVDAWDRCIAAYLNGEEWASQRYNTNPVQNISAASAAAVNTAVALLESSWQGGHPNVEHTGQGGGGAGGAAEPTSAGGPVGSGSDGGDTYVQVASKQLVGVYLTIWVRSRLLPEVRGVQVTTVATGFGGYLGNKGAVAARMRLYDSSIVFVAAHLSAGEADGDEQRRNADVHDILRRAVFQGGPIDSGFGATAMTSAHAALISASLGPGHWPAGPAGVMDHDLAIWVGDLNYRIATQPTTTSSSASIAATGGSGGGAATGAVAPVDTGAGGGGSAAAAAGVVDQRLTDAEVRVAIRSGRYDVLLPADQLNRERAAGRVFRGWHEPRVTFMPTYKFKIGTNVYLGDDTQAARSTLAAGSASASASASTLSAGPELSAESGTTSGMPLLAAEDGAAAVPAEEVEAAAGQSGAGDAEKHKRRTPAWCDRVLWWERAAALQAPKPSPSLPSQPQQPQQPLSGADGGPEGAAAGAGGASAPHVAGPQLRPLAYWRGEVVISDHKPVAAGFEAEMVSYDRRRIESLLEAALRHVDMMLQSLRPKVVVEPVVLEAGDWVALGRQVPLRITLANVGTTEAVFHFVPPPHQPVPAGAGRGSKGKGGAGSQFGLDDESPPLPRWLTAHPAEGTLQPGQRCDVEMRLLVEGGPGGAAGELAVAAAAAPGGGSTAAVGASGSAEVSLDCIAILRIVDSGDKFITIGGRYLRSFVGLPLESLATLGSEPALPPQKAEELAAQLGLGPLEVAPLGQEPGGVEEGAVAASKEICALVSALLANSAAGLRTPGIFVDSARLVLLSGETEGAAPGDAPAAAAAPAAGGEADTAAEQQPTGREQQRQLLRRLERLRLHLDASGAVPTGTSPHDTAALLLLWAAQLPRPLLPPALSDAVAAAVPEAPADAAALLRRHLTALELAVVSELLGVLRAALQPAAAGCNGLTVERLAAAVAAWWFQPLPATAPAEVIGGQRALLQLLLLSEGEAAGAQA